MIFQSKKLMLSILITSSLIVPLVGCGKSECKTVRANINNLMSEADARRAYEINEYKSWPVDENGWKKYPQNGLLPRADYDPTPGSVIYIPTYKMAVELGLHDVSNSMYKDLKQMIIINVKCLDSNALLNQVNKRIIG